MLRAHRRPAQQRTSACSAAGTLLTAIPTGAGLPVAAAVHRRRPDRRAPSRDERTRSQSRRAARQPHHDGSALYVPDQAAGLGGEVAVCASGSPGRRRRVLRPLPCATASRASAEAAIDEAPRRRAVVAGRRLPRAQPGHPLPLAPRRRRARLRWLNGPGSSTTRSPDADDFRLVSARRRRRPGIRDAVVYQIFPDRFARSAAAPSGRCRSGRCRATGTTPSIGPRAEPPPAEFYGGDLDGVDGAPRPHRARSARTPST